MRRVLLIKTSSLGDVVHNLPAISDMRAALPDVEVDWVVEESFAAIPRLHRSVKRVIPAAIRRWRRTLWRRQARDEIRDFLHRLHEPRYDAVIDTQGLLKSALIACGARGTRYGLDWASAREPLGLFYDRTFSVPWTLHAVERNRSLVAQALGYAVPEHVDYGIGALPQGFSWLPDRPYLVLLHATSAGRKLWPESHWIELGSRMAQKGVPSVLPWGGTAERARSDRLARAIAGAVVPPVLELDDVAALLAGARAVAGVDTGLAHLAAALGTPTVGIYCATDPAATGIYGCARATNLGGVGKKPAVNDVVAALGHLGVGEHDSAIG